MMDCESRLIELESQLQQRDESIKKLKQLLSEKENILLTTSEKLADSEKRRTQLELNQNECNTSTTNNLQCRRIGSENALLKRFLFEIGRKIHDSITKSLETSEEFQDFLNEMDQICSQANEELQSSQICASLNEQEDSEAVKLLTGENVQLQVRLDLEHERRIRTQLALDDAERNLFSSRRELENKSRILDEERTSAMSLKEKTDKKLRTLHEENRSLHRCIKEKEEQIKEVEAKAKAFLLKAEEFEDMFNAQLETVKKLQSDLSVASAENQVLVNEMETLSKMFYALEQRYVNYALVEFKDDDEISDDTTSQVEDGTSLVEDVLQADGKDAELNDKVLQESCFKEVTTKNGTRMVLSVSKTFMKLKDLILEKKSLEDRVEKMKAINAQLVSRVNLHEAKLFNITDELNKTWTYVSTLKLQHKHLHTSEQILRAELAEKRELLAKLREELEISRESWILVKKKTADSERQWRALRDEFAERRKLLPTTSEESGFSDVQTEEEEDSDQSKNEICHVLNVETANNEDEMSASTMTIKPNDDVITSPDEENPSEELIPIFIPPLDYVTGVPPELLPPLIPTGDPVLRLGLEVAEPQAGNLAEENYEELYSKLIASTARSAALANRLAEIHRTLTNRDDGDGLSCLEDEEDVEPKTEDDDEQESSDLHSEPELHGEHTEEAIEFGDDESDEDEITTSTDPELDDLGLSPEAMERALTLFNERDSDLDSENDIDDDGDSDTATSVRFTAPEESEVEENISGQSSRGGVDDLQESENFSIPAPVPIPLRPSFANQDSIDESDDSSDEESENATAVTRLLIKTFPKQLSKLRSEKTELEDRIQDLETQISEQNSVLAEMERRMEIYRHEAETARKWIGAIHHGKHVGEDRSGHFHLSRSSCEFSEAAIQTDLAPFEWDNQVIRNLVDVTEEGGSLHWIIHGCSEYLSIEVFHQDVSGSLSKLEFDIQKQENSTDVTISRLKEGICILNIRSTEHNKKLHAHDYVIEVRRELELNE